MPHALRLVHLLHRGSLHAAAQHLREFFAVKREVAQGNHGALRHVQEVQGVQLVHAASRAGVGELVDEVVGRLRNAKLGNRVAGLHAVIALDVRVLLERLSNRMGLAILLVFGVFRHEGLVHEAAELQKLRNAAKERGA